MQPTTSDRACGTTLRYRLLLCGLLIMAHGPSAARGDEALGEHGTFLSGEVKLHYVTRGKGPLVVMLHGFPDYWYTWRHQIPALSEHFQTVALDLRGYNKSGQPQGVENYTMAKLTGDVVALIDHFKRKKAVVVGHDWGGAIAWAFAMRFPERIERLIILNLPHPRGLLRELANNPRQQAASQYARNFQQSDAAANVQPEMLTFWVKDESAQRKYLEAFKRSSIEGMLNYYKANYPRPPYEVDDARFPAVRCPVLMFHGLDDPALLPDALNGTWKWVDSDLTIVTVPGAGHFVQHDVPELVTDRMLRWLVR